MILLFFCSEILFKLITNGVKNDVTDCYLITSEENLLLGHHLNVGNSINTHLQVLINQEEGISMPQSKLNFVKGILSQNLLLLKLVLALGLKSPEK